MALMIRLRAWRRGARSRWICGVHQGEDGGLAPWRRMAHLPSARKAGRRRPAPWAQPQSWPARVAGHRNIRGSRAVRVIASSLRKGAVVEVDSHLYVIL